MFKRILAAFDSPERSGRALAEAADLARLCGAELTLLTVVPSLASWIETATVPPPKVFELQTEIEDAWRARTQAAARSLPDDLRVTSKLRTGHAGREIVAQAQAGKHDLVVVGARSGDDADPPLLGSVSHHVAHRSPVPVLIV